MSPANNHSARQPQCLAVVGLQWGDEGKGKIVDLLTSGYDAVVRYNGGANAGHSVVIKGERYALHLIPAGILTPGKLAVIGNGVVIDPRTLLKELDTLRTRAVATDGLVISDRAHVVMPYHQAEDAFREDTLKRASEEDFAEGGAVSQIGTTRRGIGPCYADKVQRGAGIRIADLLRPDVLATKIELACRLKRSLLADSPGEILDPRALTQLALEWGRQLAPMIRDTTYLLHEELAEGKRLLFEGANGTLLDVDHGTYPFVTGSSCITSGIGTGTGVPATRLDGVIGVMKAYSTRVGSGPMPTELANEIGQRIRDRGREYGTTTGRPRRVGWLDLVAVRYAAMLNGTTSIAITLLDVLAGLDELKVCVAYRIRGRETDRFPADATELAQVEPVYRTLSGFAQEIGAARSLDELPAPARAYAAFIEEFVGVPVSMISVGPDREQTMHIDVQSRPQAAKVS